LLFISVITKKKRLFLLSVFLYVIAYSRISDYQHHWQDVLFGGIVGSLIAFVTFKFILHWQNYSTQSLPYTISPPSPIYQGRNANYRRMTPYNEPGKIRF
jgi:membrane-associated phospholipid phosphatase